MKKLTKISLQSIGQAELKKKELSLLKGGSGCPTQGTCKALGCGCLYVGGATNPDDSFYGGSSKHDNNDANVVVGMANFDGNIGALYE